MADKVGIEHQLLNLNGKLTASYNKIKTTVETGRNITTDAEQLGIFEARYKDLKHIYDNFESILDEIRLLSIQSGQPFPDSNTKTLNSNAERYYYECCSLYNTYFALNLDKTNDTDRRNTTSDMNSSRARLPKITLPHFSGALQDWGQFKDTFTSLVHNDTSLSPIEKFHYLLGATSGPPHKILKGIPLVEANYSLALKALLERYDNKRLLASSYLETLLNFEPMKKKATLSSLQSLLGVVGENVAALQTMVIPDLADFILFSIVIRLLDPVTRKEFESDHVHETYPTFDSLKTFIKTQCQVFEISAVPSLLKSTSDCQSSGPKSSLFSTSTSEQEHSKRSSDTSSSTSGQPQSHNYLCPSCKSTHRLSECPKFLALTPQQRYNAIKTYHVCFNCFGKHDKNNCKSPYTCRRCKSKHHTLLHFTSNYDKQNSSKALPKSEPPSPGQNNVVNTAPPPPQNSSSLAGLGNSSDVLLGTAIAHIYDANNIPHTVRLVIDSGSHYSFISAGLAKQLGLTETNFKQPISGVGQTVLSGARKKLRCTLTPQNCSEPRLTTEAIIVPSITTSLPTTDLPPSVYKQFTSLQLADSRFWEPAPVQFLLGSDLFMSVLTGGQLSFSKEGPGGLSTIFGWVVMGKFKTTSNSDQGACSLFVSSDPPPLDNIIKKFWELEEPSSSNIIYSSDEQKCEKHFVDTHSRDTSGRYNVCFPFNSSDIVLEDNRKSVLSRFFKLEQRLLRQPHIYDEYNSFLKEYLNLGHMSVAKRAANYIIPHHCVIKNESSTTKLRVVFDASFKTSGRSLNEYLLPGPKLQVDICDITMNFRRHAVVFTSDICKMYRQILINNEDKIYQHIFWRFSPEDPVQEYELDTVTYGTTSAPFQSLRVIKQLVQDEGNDFPEAVPVLLEDMYIDNIATGTDDVITALLLQQQLIEILNRGGFELRKWSSNCPDLLKSVPSEHHEQPLLFSDKNDPIIKLLGLQWDPRRDGFSYHISAPSTIIFSKRAILSTIARIFDPLGFLSPVVFYAKHILQQLWHLNIDWDTDLPQHIKNLWSHFIENISILSDIFIPRRVLTDNLKSIYILGFCDASQKGYSATLYIRTLSTSGEVVVHLLKAKSKLAPLKTISVPRLELCGALLLSRLLRSIRSFTNKINVKHIYLFTDSTIVLCWLSTSPHLLKTFVANRVTTITNITNIPICSWHHVSTDFNPSDCSSRGLSPRDFLECSLWWKGPSFVYEPIENWSLTCISTGNTIDSVPELKVKESVSLIVTAESLSSKVLENIINYHSSYTRLIRSLAYIFRYLNNLKIPNPDRSPTLKLSVKEIKDTTLIIIKFTQSIYFQRELEDLSKNSCSKNLVHLTPFMDESGILRVGGRLRKSDLPDSSKHPILLPSDCHLSTLIVDYFHKVYLHAGPKLVSSLVQQEYWILGVRSLIRHRILKCNICCKLKAISKIPIMGDLPASRFAQGRPFINVAIDFAGPFYIKESTRRNARVSKAYLCVYVCMATKAVHLEVVSSLSTDAFLASFDRFVARRSLCSRIYSDCGSNFKSAARHILDIQRLILDKNSQDMISEHMSKYHVTWVFQPPYAPNFNGLVESGVKSAKFHLTRIVGDKALNFEELSTVFCRIEAILNSRPLTPLSTNPHERDTLTAGHFLVGSALVAPPELDVTDIAINRLDRWQVLKRFIQHFWQRWTVEYLNTLQQRVKWTLPTRNLAVGDLVWVKSLTTSPLHWPLGLISATHPGEDGVVRVITVKTSSGVYRRATSKVVLMQATLPSEESS